MLFACQTIFAQDTLLVPTQDGLNEHGCYSPVKPREATWVKSIAEANVKLNRCKTQLNPDTLTVDFTKNDLVFYTYSTGGGVLEFSQNLYKIPTQKKYILIVKIKNNWHQNLVNIIHRIVYVTPKLDTTYTLEYKKIETHVPTPQSFIDRK